MAPHSSTLAWRIPWTEEPGRLQSMGSLRVKQDWVTSLSLFTFMHWRRKWQPTPVFLPGESQERGAWWAAIYGVAQSQTRLKRLSSSSSSQLTIVVTVSGEQQRDSAIHIHVSILPQTPLQFGLPHNIEQSSMCYTVGFCWLSLLNRAETPKSLTIILNFSLHKNPLLREFQRWKEP